VYHGVLWIRSTLKSNKINKSKEISFKKKQHIETTIVFGTT